MEDQGFALKTCTMKTRKIVWKTLDQNTRKTLIIFLSLVPIVTPAIKNRSLASGVTFIPEEKKVHSTVNSEDPLEFRMHYQEENKYQQDTHKPEDNINMTVSHIISREGRFVSSHEGGRFPSFTERNLTDLKFPNVSTKILKDVAGGKDSNDVSPTLFPKTFKPITWPLTNRERYLTTSGPFVLLNNHRPPSYISNGNNNAYHWLLRPVTQSTTQSLDSSAVTTFPTFLITRQTSSFEELDANTAPTYVMSNLSFVKEDSKDHLARPTALVHTNLMIAQKLSSEVTTEHPAVKPTKTVEAVSNSIQSIEKTGAKESTASTTKRPSSLTTRYTEEPHLLADTTTAIDTTVTPWSDSGNYISPTSEGIKRPISSLQPVTTALSTLVANLFRNSIIGTFLLMIPSALFAMMLL